MNNEDMSNGYCVVDSCVRTVCSAVQIVVRLDLTSFLLL